MKGDERKIYEYLEFSFELPEEQRKIVGSRKCHMISYFPSGEIQIKEEISSWEFCYDGNFVNCDNRGTGPIGRVHMIRNSSDSDFYDFDVSDFGEFHDEFDEYEDDLSPDMEKNELFTNTEFSNTIDVVRIISIYSSQTVNELFFLSLYVNFLRTTQMSTFLMTMIIIFQQAMITWSVIILHLKTFDKEMFNINW